MAKVLVVGEFKGGQLKKSLAELVSAARGLSTEIDGALLGTGSGAAAAGMGQYGIGTVHVLDGELPVYSSDAFAAALAGAVKAGGYGYVLLMQSQFGRDLGARL